MPFDERDWAAFLSRELGSPVRVRFGRARTRVLEARPLDENGLEIRMSAFFGDAAPPVRDAVVRWLRSGRRARRAAALLDQFIAETLEKLPPRPARTVRIRPRGKHHDLADLARELVSTNSAPANPERWPRITWGRRARSRARRSLQLGCYVSEEGLIRIHSALDSDWVPSWFVRYVLFHELLHVDLPPVRTAGGRTLHHGPEFRRRERQYPDYRRALAWQEENLPDLLRAARGLPPRRARKTVRPLVDPLASRGTPRQAVLFSEPPGPP